MVLRLRNEPNIPVPVSITCIALIQVIETSICMSIENKKKKKIFGKWETTENILTRKTSTETLALYLVKYENYSPIANRTWIDQNYTKIALFCLIENMGFFSRKIQGLFLQKKGKKT